MISAPPAAHGLRIVYSRHFSNCCFYAVSQQAVYHAISLRVGAQIPLALWGFPEPILLIFKIPSFKSHQLLEPTKFSLSYFQSQIWRFVFPWGFPSVIVCFLPSSMPWFSPSLSTQDGYNSPLSLHPSYPLDVASSLPLLIKFVLPIFGVFSGLYTVM